MNRNDFMRQLEMLLSDITPNERNEALQFYNDYFDDAGAENEQAVIKALGSPAKVAASIKSDLMGNAAAGEFTETGYKDSYSKTQEVIRYGQPDTEKDSAGNQNGAGQKNPYSNNPYGNNPYANNTYGNNAYGNNAYGNNTYGNNSCSNNPYGGTAYTNGQKSQNGAFEKGNTQSGNAGSSGKSGMSGGTLALVILLCFFGIPILVPLGAAMVGLVVAAAAVVASLVIAVAAIAFTLVLLGIVLMIVGISKLLVLPFGGMCLAGAGLVCMGVGILFVILTLWLCVTVVPAIVKVTAELCRKLFLKKKRKEQI